ncbi:MAG: IclR family transcriptional regulator [Chloroflexi bacterium]|nr:IclR family transcriptional regulator [Chloroflexota bacterium]
MNDTTEYGIRAVERAGSVLRALGAASGPLALPAISATVGLSRPTTFRLLRTLMSQGLVLADDGRYTLGFGILELAQALTRQLDVVAITRPVLIDLRSTLNETCGLAIRSGDACVPVALIETTQSVRRVVPLGAHLALYSSSTGKVMLAHDDDADVDAYLARTELIPYSSATVCQPDRLRAELQQIRQSGSCASVNGRGDGGASVSFPVYRHGGALAAVAFIACPASRFTEELRERCLEAGGRAARQMSDALGYRRGEAARPFNSIPPVADEMSPVG